MPLNPSDLRVGAAVMDYRGGKFAVLEWMLYELPGADAVWMLVRQREDGTVTKAYVAEIVLVRHFHLLRPGPKPLAAGLLYVPIEWVTPDEQPTEDLTDTAQRMQRETDALNERHQREPEDEAA